MSELIDRIEACETIMGGTIPATVNDMRLCLQEVVGILKEIVEPRPDLDVLAALKELVASVQIHEQSTGHAVAYLANAYLAIERAERAQ